MDTGWLSRYRLATVNQDIDQTVSALLSKEAGDRARSEQLARRAAVSRIVANAVNQPPTTDKNEIYNRSTRAMMSLLPYGPEGAQAANLINASVANYAKLNPPQRASSKGRPHMLVDVAETPDTKKWPLTKQFGNETKRLQRIVWTDTNTPSDWYTYGAGGNIVSESDKTASRQKEQRLSELENAKRGLESKILTKYKNNISLDKILSGEADIPMAPKFVKDTDLTSPTYGQFIKTPEEAPDKDILDWVDTIGQLESEMSQQGKSFTPARALAKEKAAPKTKKRIEGF